MSDAAPHADARADREIEAGCLYDLTIACVFQDEAPWLKEWIEFHCMLGVQRFVLVDDRSRDDFLAVLRPYLDAGIVELLAAPCPEALQGRQWPQYQCSVHAMLVERLRGVSRWLALVDIDEFIVPRDTDDLVAFLRGYEDYGGLYVRWEPFGTSYLQKLSGQDLMIERLYLKWRFRRGHEMLGKSIVKPHRVLHANIHRCDLLPGFPYYDSNPGMESETSPIKVYHYWSRDESYLLTHKLPRLAQIKGWNVHEMHDYFVHLFNDVPDHSMRRFAPALRARVYAEQPAGDRA